MTILENLRFIAPHLLQAIKNELIANDGMPLPNGYAKGGYVRAAEIQYNATPGSYWYRPIRPNDTFCGATANTYSYTYTAQTEMGIFGTAAATENSVPTREMIVCFGWYTEIELGRGSYLLIEKHGVPKQEVPARIVYRQQDPDHLFVDLDTVIFGVENEKFKFITYNAYDSDRAGQVLPLLYRIAPRTALNLELVR